MCLALPALLLERLSADQGRIDLGGVRKTVSLALVPEAKVGDYVIVHVGHAIGVVDADEAAATLALFAQMQAEEGAR
ncbi:MAG: HypC/HybG/HupF family hydrogenase formation chaperone [Rubrivivax sp.]|jgi:hydrogenase expression/formation protein HypC|nr:HypC/HybG/HupF family hydrogenase formation chaperone [Rubrivivax sp.]